MHVPEIIEVKEHLEKLKTESLIVEWQLPYENLLTRRSAAIFFVEGVEGRSLDEVWDQLGKYEHFHARLNEEKKLSELSHRITFSAEEKEKASN